MADFSTLIATLQATIKTNYNQEITGQILQDDLLAMVNTINQLKQDTLEGYGFYGAPLADGASVNVTQNTFFLVGPGTYTINGEANTIAGAGISLLVYDSVNDEVRVDTLISYDTTPTAASKNAITSGAVKTALDLKADKSTTYTKSETDNLLNGKVDKEAGKGLSSNDYTDAEKTKLGALPTAAELSTDLAAKQDKDTDAVAGNVAVMDASGNSVDGGTPLSDLATKSEVAVATLPGLAEAVIDTDGAGTEQEFTFRKSGGDGGAYYRKILGRSLVWNQLVRNDLQSGTESAHGTDLSFTVDGHDIIINGTSPASNGYSKNIMPDSWQQINGHYYLTILRVPSGVSGIGVVGRSQAGWQAIADGQIAAATMTTGQALAIRVVSNSTFNNVRVTPQIFDLTQMFGAGNEPSTVAEFEALFPDAYYPYNPGTLISNDAEAVETTGRNQYNPATGKAQVIGGTTYYIGGTYTSLSQEGVAITPAGDGTFTPASTGEVEVVGGNATDTIVNISDADNGLWQPYWKRTLQLALTTKEDTDGNVPFADGMKGDGWTHADECDKNGGSILIRKIVFNGTESWRYDAGSFLYTLPIAPLRTNIYGRGFGLSNKFGINSPAVGYPALGTWDITGAFVGFSNALVPALAGSTNPQDWKDWLAAQYANGTPLEMVYAIATPVPFTWAEPLNLGVKVDENGTERAVAPEGATAPSAPFVADTTYTMSVARMVEKLQNL